MHMICFLAKVIRIILNYTYNYLPVHSYVSSANFLIGVLRVSNYQQWQTTNKPFLTGIAAFFPPNFRWHCLTVTHFFLCQSIYQMSCLVWKVGFKLICTVNAQIRLCICEAWWGSLLSTHNHWILLTISMTGKDAAETLAAQNDLNLFISQMLLKVHSFAQMKVTTI